KWQVTTRQEARGLWDGTGSDGELGGRVERGRPAIYDRSRHYIETGELLPEPSVKERIDLCAEQLRRSVQHHGERYGVIIMKKHYGQYLKGVHNSRGLRSKIMKEEKMQPILDLLYRFKDEEMFAKAS